MLIIQAAFMYVAHLPFYLALILENFESVPEDLIGWLMISGFIIFLCTIPLCLASIGVACSNFAFDVASPVKTAMIVKLCLMPWFVVNFVICAVMAVGFLNPWLMLAVPALICLEVGVTYLLMLSTGMHTIAYTVRILYKNKIKPDAMTIITLILHLIFCLDVVGAIMMCFKIKKLRSQIV